MVMTKIVEFKLHAKRLPAKLDAADCKQQALLKACHDALGMDQAVLCYRAANLNYGYIIVRCTESQFVNWLLLRTKYGADNWMQELDAHYDSSLVGDRVVLWDVIPAAERVKPAEASKAEEKTFGYKPAWTMLNEVKDWEALADWMILNQRTRGFRFGHWHAYKPEPKRPAEDYGKTVADCADRFPNKMNFSFERPLKDVYAKLAESMERDETLEEVAKSFDERAAKSRRHIDSAPGRLKSQFANSAQRHEYNAKIIRAMKGGKTAAESFRLANAIHARDSGRKFLVTLATETGRGCGESSVRKVIAYFLPPGTHDTPLVKIDGEQTYLDWLDQRIDWSTVKSIPGVEGRMP
jgi:hypothetical protein